MRIAVIGAGIGGLATAAGLQRDRHDVTVFERAARPRPSGSGLSLWGNGFAALESLGLADRVRAVGSTTAASLAAGQRTPTGRWLARIPAAAVTELVIVHRRELDAALRSALAPGTVHFGADVLEAGSDPAGAWLRLRRGDQTEIVERYDLVVAADGINSRVRTSRPDDPGVRYSGYAAWRGVTAHPVDLLGAAGEAWGRGERFGMAPLADGRVYWFAVVSMPARTAIADEYGTVLERFGHWHRPIRELIEATSPADVFRTDIEYLADGLSSFVDGRVVLLGDAAHAMTPDLGQGGGQALEDAATLVALLAGRPAVERALAEYDRLRRPRTRAIGRQARVVGRIAQWHGPIVTALRNGLLRLTPATLAGRRLAAVQSWLPPTHSIATG